MPSYLVKVDRERDAYIVWSTVVESPVELGTRAELQAENSKLTDERFNRADASGTSARFFDWLPDDQQELGWADADGVICEQRGFLPRTRLGDVYDLYGPMRALRSRTSGSSRSTTRRTTMPDLLFIDTETTGIDPDDEIWEFWGERYFEGGGGRVLHLFIEHDDMRCARLPEPFASDHRARWPHTGPTMSKRDAALHLSQFLARGDNGSRPLWIGAVPSFDATRVEAMLRSLMPGWTPAWDYHLVDVEALMLGWLVGRGGPVPLPWHSDVLSRLVGVEPPDSDRHTAEADARWAMAIWDRVMGAHHG